MIWHVQNENVILDSKYHHAILYFDFFLHLPRGKQDAIFLFWKV
jgi:hypothetical protein